MSTTVARVLLEHIAAVVALRAAAQQRSAEGKSLRGSAKATGEIERPPELESEADETALLNSASALAQIQRLESAGAPAETTAPMLENFRRSHDRRWARRCRKAEPRRPSVSIGRHVRSPRRPASRTSSSRRPWRSEPRTRPSRITAARRLLFERARRQAEALGRTDLEAQALFGIGFVYMLEKRYRDAGAVYQAIASSVPDDSPLKQEALRLIEAAKRGDFAFGLNEVPS